MSVKLDVEYPGHCGGNYSCYADNNEDNQLILPSFLKKQVRFSTSASESEISLQSQLQGLGLKICTICIEFYTMIWLIN